MSRRFGIPAAVLGLLAALPAASSAATITQILESPSAYNGQHVDVKGTVEHLQSSIYNRRSRTREIPT